MRPEAHGRSRETVFSVVVFPEPFDPTRDRISPARTSRKMPQMAWISCTLICAVRAEPGERFCPGAFADPPAKVRIKGERKIFTFPV